MKISLLFLVLLVVYSNCFNHTLRQRHSQFHHTKNNNCIPTAITPTNQTQILAFDNSTDAYTLFNKAFFYAYYKGVVYDQTSYNSFIVTDLINKLNTNQLSLDKFFSSAQKAIIFTQLTVRNAKGVQLIDETAKVTSIFAFKSIVKFLQQFYIVCYQ